MSSPTSDYTITDPLRKVQARYFEGCGLNGTFLEYLFNGATGSDIGQECQDVYEYIANNYTPDTDIWLFGHSRGSFTVRCVAGMINNCGIINKKDMSSEQIQSLCKEVYKMYRSPYPEEAPDSSKMKNFRAKASWASPNSVKFMGIIDTVGGLGIPKLDAGIGFTWPEFFDQNVSAEVQKVYHACSLHDRLWMFQPCRAHRDTKRYPGNLGIHEKWFPGCHYDVGRQKFKFLRNGVNTVEQLFFHIPDLLTKAVVPNEVCADLVLVWLLEAVRDEDGIGTLIPDIDDMISEIQSRLYSGTLDIGSGDIYGKMTDYTPAGIFGSAFSLLTSFTVKLTDHISPSLKLGSAIQDFLGIKTLLNILLATQDRRIPDVDADVVPLFDGGEGSVYERAGLGRYESRTFEGWRDYLRVIGKKERGA